MTIFRAGLSESAIDRHSIHAKPTKSGFLYRAHTKVTGTDIPADNKYALDINLAEVTSDTNIPTEDSGDKNEFFLENTVVSDGNVQTAINYTVLAGDTLRLNNVLASSGAQIVCKIYKNATLIGTTRSGAANKQATFKWEPNRTFVTGDVLTITVQDISGGPGFGNDMDVFFQGRKY
jgi:hypothetical protein